MKTAREALEDIAEPLISAQGVVKHVDFEEVVELVEKREAELTRKKPPAPESAEKKLAGPDSW